MSSKDSVPTLPNGRPKRLGNPTRMAALERAFEQSNQGPRPVGRPPMTPEQRAAKLAASPPPPKKTPYERAEALRLAGLARRITPLGYVAPSPAQARALLAQAWMALSTISRPTAQQRQALAALTSALPPDPAQYAPPVPE